MFNLLKFKDIPIPTDPPKHPYLNDATGGGGNDYGVVGDIASQVADGIQKGFAKAIVWMIDKATPFVCFTCEITIAACIVIFFCSKDKRCITTGVRALVIMLIFLFLEWYVHL